MEYCPDNYDAWRWHEDEQERKHRLEEKEEFEESEER